MLSSLTLVKGGGGKDMEAWIKKKELDRGEKLEAGLHSKTPL